MSVAIRITLALVAVLLVAACGGNGGAPAPLDLSAADNGGAITVQSGQLIEIALESNASTGYQWNLVDEPDQAVALFVSSEYVEPVDTDLVGAPGTEVWTFRAVSEGTTTLRLEYFRPFEPTTVGGEFVVTLEVE